MTEDEIARKFDEAITKTALDDLEKEVKEYITELFAEEAQQ